MENPNPDSVVHEKIPTVPILKPHSELAQQFKEDIAAFFLFSPQKQERVLNLLQRAVLASVSTATLRELIEEMT